MEKKLDAINTTLGEMSASLKIISGAMVKPENKTEKILQYVMAGVSIAGILTIVDVVIKWIIGG
jgi:triosephosphate isomerase